MAKSYITTGRVAENRKARHEYEIEDRVEAGPVSYTHLTLPTS